MNFLVSSQALKQAIEEFYNHLSISSDIRDHILLEKILQCGFQVLLISKNDVDFRKIQSSIIAVEDLELVIETWRKISSDAKIFFDNNHQLWQQLNQITKRIGSGLPYENSLLRKLPDDQNVYILFLVGLEPYCFPKSELSVLCNLWQTQNNHLLLHSAAIVHRDYQFLFCGPSDAGKSTITSLSQGADNQIIDEDQVSLYKLSHSTYSTNGWGYKLTASKAPLRAIFRIVQDTADALIPITQYQTAHLLLNRHADIMGGYLSDEQILNSFQFASQIARSVPGYDLHFRKSPDFWQLIDKEFNAS